MDSIFSRGERTDVSNKLPNESWFRFLERSGLPEMEEARNRLDRWFHVWPAPRKEDTLNKLRSRRTDTSHGAMFELYLHYKLLDLECSVEIERPVTVSNNREPLHPDFFVQYEDARCYVEAFVASDKWYSDAEADSLARLEKELNKHHSKDFFLGITLSRVPEQSLRYRKLIRPIIDWMNSQDPGISEADYPTQPFALRLGNDTSLVPVPPEYGWDNPDAIILEVELGPVSPEWRTDDCARNRPLVAFITPLDGSRDHGHAQLKERIRDKVSKYPELDAPLVVAAGMMWIPSNIELGFSFYGRPTESFSQSESGEFVPPGTSVTPDGIWLRKESGRYFPRAPHLLGVWRFDAPLPNNPSPRTCLYTNPYAKDLVKSLPSPIFSGYYTYFTEAPLGEVPPAGHVGALGAGRPAPGLRPGVVRG